MLILAMYWDRDEMILRGREEILGRGRDNASRAAARLTPSPALVQLAEARSCAVRSRDAHASPKLPLHVLNATAVSLAKTVRRSPTDTA
jgi:hypothetical protein